MPTLYCWALIGPQLALSNFLEALTRRIEMQEHIKTRINTYSNCTSIIIGDMNAIVRASDRTSNTTYQADRTYREGTLQTLDPAYTEATTFLNNLNSTSSNQLISTLQSLRHSVTNLSQRQLKPWQKAFLASFTPPTK
eukprot:1158445-Pelagomonas_calceolata.AAC.4